MFTYSQEDLKKYLIEADLIENKQIEKFDDLASEKSTKFQNILIEQNILDNQQLGLVIADITGVKYVSLKEKVINDSTLNILPPKVARNFRAVVFEIDNNEVKVAITNLDHIKLIHSISKKTGKNVIPFLANEDELEDSLALYSSSNKVGIEIDLGAIFQDNNGDGTVDNIDVEHLFQLIINNAYHKKASDIHIEPDKEFVKIRFRIDGMLHTVANLPPYIHDNIVSHLKVLARLRTDEHFVPQDGRFVYIVDNMEVAVRVSILPVYYGEKVNLRLLVARMKDSSLSDLGFSNKDRMKIEHAGRSTKGIIIMTGPTGSGKTTTLYSILKNLNNDTVNISTIEDPIEYHLDGINQTQVNRKAKYDFSSGLRALLRQDPDIIMVGEIRDHETAQIAMNAALTGHLVLATLHTNTAIQAIPRLLDMDIEPFVIANTVNIFIAQRLVRRLCKSCASSEPATDDEYKLLHNLIKDGDFKTEVELKYRNGDLRLFKGTGCEKCAQSGFNGRSIISEAFLNNEKIQELIGKKARSGEIEEAAIDGGMTTMVEDGVRKALLGVTTISEILRVIND